MKMFRIIFSDLVWCDAFGNFIGLDMTLCGSARSIQGDTSLVGLKANEIAQYISPLQDANGMRFVMSVVPFSCFAGSGARKNSC